MTIGIRIVGLREVQRTLGVDIKPALQAATKAIALEVQGEIAPYPPATMANSPSNPTGKWYQREYGPRWRRKDGTIGGRKTSETLTKVWGIKATGGIGAVLGNKASYAEFVHSKTKQARWMARIGWVTDEAAVDKVVRSGRVQAHVTKAIMARLRRG